jgi:hypothetical protein
VKIVFDTRKGGSAPEAPVAIAERPKSARKSKEAK